MSGRSDKTTRRVPEVEVRQPAEGRVGEGRDARALADEEQFEEIETQTIFAFLSAVKRAGRWEPADQIDATAFMGDVTLDFARAELPPSGIVEIHTAAIMGSIKIIAPPGADVEVEGIPLLGSFEQKSRRRARDVVRDWVTGGEGELAPDEDPPLIRVTGFALLGSVEVHMP